VLRDPAIFAAWLRSAEVVEYRAAPHGLFGQEGLPATHIIRQMTAQLNLPVCIVGGETVRARDGLALSSRNQYLTEDERGERFF